MRGEDAIGDLASGLYNGAPPRAWGGRVALEVVGDTSRSTPTCVGRTGYRSASRVVSTEHPHVRGEDPNPASGSRMTAGAPPRAWGGHHIVLTLVRIVRSTPTCVGRTQWWRPCSPDSAEHPHVRGED